MSARGILNRQQIARVLISLLHAETSALRRGSATVPEWAEWTEETQLRDGGLGLDSLELLVLSSAVNEMFHVHETVLEDLLLRYKKTSQWVELLLRSLSQYNERLTFRTSGSTGSPQACEHTLSSLLHETADWASMLQTDGGRRILAAVPAHHIYGFVWTVLLPQEGGLELVEARHWDPGQWTQRVQPGDVIIGHPAFWSAVGRAVRQWPTGVTAVTSTARMPAPVAATLQQRGLTQLLEVYGSTETAGIASRRDVSAPFQLLPSWKPSQESSFPDEIAWVDERSFVVVGRKDSVVQVGGFNVQPREVERRLCECPLLKEAAVRLMDAGEGSRLKAFLVFAHGGLDTPQNRKRVETWIVENLKPIECPKAIRFGDKLPRNEMGKLCNWEWLADEEPEPVFA
jgi:long-chain acyl-CoA synthetase